MTLTVTSSNIEIKNSAGQVKFSANNKLVFIKGVKTGRMTIQSDQRIYIPWQQLGSNEFVVFSVFVHSCTGAVGASLVNKWVPANSNIIVGYDAGTYIDNANYYVVAEQDNLSCGHVGSNLIFDSRKYSAEFATTLTPNVTTDFTYRAIIMRYF